MLQTRIKNRLIRRGIVALALLATLPGAPVAAGQTFDEAVAAYDRGDYATAVRGFLVHAEQGDATPNTNSVSCTTTAGAYRRTMPKRCAGTAGCQAGASVCRYSRRGLERRGAGEPDCRDERLGPRQGHAGAQFNLGLMYANGAGVLKDDAEAVRWYRLAADQGLAGAQLNLGNRYANGAGVLKDDAEAVRWYRLAAEQGQASAQFNLGNRYYTGRGVLKDDAEAVAGTVWPPTRVTPLRSPISGSCTPTGGAFSRTMPKRRAGTVWPPTRVTPLRSSISGTGTTTGGASSRTMRSGALVPSGRRPG